MFIDDNRRLIDKTRVLRHILSQLHKSFSLLHFSDVETLASIWIEASSNKNLIRQFSVSLFFSYNMYI